ncbi:MAG: hypothetical protein Q7R89_00255 [bacterium]|nr:hypothetical protein [bacterium]
MLPKMKVAIVLPPTITVVSAGVKDHVAGSAVRYCRSSIVTTPKRLAIFAVRIANNTDKMILVSGVSLANITPEHG